MYIKNQKFLVFGISKSGYSVAKLLLKRNATCYLYEEVFIDRVNVAIKELESLGAKLISKENIDKVLEEIDVLILSPGVPINHDLSVKAKGLGKRIIGEFEFGSSLLKNPFIAITGTNGKTTTCYLLKNILEKEEKVRLLGNVGTPITSCVDEISSDEILITEISSFQLETTYAFMPHIMCVLNVTPDHLERHYTMDNYIFLKRKLLKNAKESEYAVLNYDDEIVSSFEENLLAKKVWFSLNQKVDGAYLLDNKIFYFDEYIIDVDKIPIKGNHNIQNVLASICMAKIMGISSENIVNGLVGFKGVKHRIEEVATINDITFYNDSKATNTASTISAIKSLEGPIVLILGGREKGEKYDKLFKEIKNSFVTNVVLTGESRFNMFSSATAEGYMNLTITENFDNAVRIAYMLAKPNEKVLLSPGCASFDSFENYEARGERFCELVENLK
ncbi:MAG: UDP-N-acetylmuramoyl-L-alanine--D-glutamate ligase [Clostridia bacterium]|nr:UDP-N-acetylmuramoyl-L-alanine--D-glutamate ligase [Clostridia bacterium]